MPLLLTINPDKIIESNALDWRRREAARGVVINAEGKVALLHVRNDQYYKLPGGGIEEGEDATLAFSRECLEEIGVSVQIIRELGTIIEYRTAFRIVQSSHCFVAEATSEPAACNFTESERAAGFEVVWVDIAEAVELLALHKTTDYEGKFIEERDSCILKATWPELG